MFDSKPNETMRTAPSLLMKPNMVPGEPLSYRCDHLGCSAQGGNMDHCPDCQAVCFCKSEHYTVSDERHEYFCEVISKARRYLAMHEASLVSLGPESPFLWGVGVFWTLESTQPYMEARLFLARQLALIGTLVSVKEAAGHHLDMLSLSRADQLGVRFLLPEQLLRLELDERCYELIVKWETARLHCDAKLANPGLSYPEIDSFSVLDSVFVDRNTPLDFVVALIVLKLKLLVDICLVKTVRQLAAKPPSFFYGLNFAPIWEVLMLHASRAPISMRLYRESPPDLNTIERDLIHQVTGLGWIADSINPHLVDLLCYPENSESLLYMPEHAERGTRQEAVVVTQHIWPAIHQAVGVSTILGYMGEYAVRSRMDAKRSYRSAWDHLKLAVGAYMSGRRPSEIKRRDSGGMLFAVVNCTPNMPSNDQGRQCLRMHS